MKLTINRADNGYLLTYAEEDNEGHWVTKYIVVEEQEHDADTTRALLLTITEWFGLLGSKHDERRIHISVKKREE